MEARKPVVRRVSENDASCGAVKSRSCRSREEGVEAMAAW
jgi:hypothetical protein